MAELKIYRLKSQKLTGSIYACYRDGYFASLDIDTKTPLTNEQFRALITALPPTVEEISGANKLNLQPVKVRSVQEKIIIFCKTYRYYRNTNYVPKTQEKANIKNVPVNDDLLRIFFTAQAWWSIGNYTLSNYIKRINNIKDLLKNGEEKKPEFPDKPDHKFEKGLPPDVLSRYNQHLRSLGWNQTYSAGGGNKWVKE